MPLLRTGLCALCLLLLVGTASAQDAAGRLYGRILTTDGDTFEGFIRWDKNEVSWVDILDGSKRFTRPQRENSNERSISVFGIEIHWADGDGGGTTTRESGIRFGHVARLEPTGSNEARLTLRSGEEVTFRGGSTDLGNDMRELIIEDARRGTVELRWRDVERVDLGPARTRAASRFGERLYGTLTTRDGETFTGFVCWDIDEVLTEDVLDGEDRDDRDREIRFGTIAMLERNSSSSTRVRLRSGETLVLRGTNDVNSGNRGILILDPNLGQVRVGWSAFDRLTFEAAPHAVAYNDFRGSGPLHGTVTTYDGQTFTGLVRWDDDEAAAWELLNGELDDVELKIEFGLIAEIAHRSSRSATVTLRDGRSFDLRGSNDVDSGNDGIYVTLKNGETVRVDWDNFKRVVFDKP